MKNSLKKGLIIAASSLAFVGIVFAAPFSRIVYSIYDSIRTKKIIKEMENNQNGGGVQEDYVKRSYIVEGEEDNTAWYKILTLTGSADCEIAYYEYDTETPATKQLVRMQGEYTRKGNVVTFSPETGISVTAGEPTTYVNGNTEENRETIYSSTFGSSKEIALQSDGTFEVGGKSDSKEELGVPEGRTTYTYNPATSRPTYETIVLADDGTYYIQTQSLQSDDHTITVGSFLAKGTYTVNEEEVVVTRTESGDVETSYSVVTVNEGYAGSYGRNGTSDMFFDAQAGGGFSQWYKLSFSSNEKLMVSKTGFTFVQGKLEEEVPAYGFRPYDEMGSGEEEGETYLLRLEVATSMEGKPFVLVFNKDGTAQTGWTAYVDNTMKDISWSVVGGALTLDMGDSGYTYEITQDGDNYKIAINYGQMGTKEFTMTAAQYELVCPSVFPMTLEVATSDPTKPFVLTFNKNGTARTGWTMYEQTIKDIAWSVVGGALTLDMGDSGYTCQITKDGDNYKIAINYGQMGTKDFTMTAAQFESACSAVFPMTLEVATSDPTKPFVLTFNADGTASTGWTMYAQTIKGISWSVVGGALTLDMGDSGYTYEITQDGDNYKIAINYGQMGTKEFTMSALQFETVRFASFPMTLEVATSVEGKPFVLVFNKDGTAQTGWTAYADNTMKDIAWSVVGGTLTLDMGDSGYTYEITQDGDNYKIAINYGQMGTKDFTMTAAQRSALNA